MSAYDTNNIFAKILRGEFPCHKVFEDEHVFAFLDIMPRAPGHTLVLPKAPARNLLDAPADDLAHVAKVAHPLTSLSFSLAERAVLTLGSLGFACLLSRLMPFSLPDFARHAKQVVDTLRPDKHTAIVVCKDDILRLDQKITESRGA